MRTPFLCLLASALISTSAAAQTCAGNPVSVQVLGSGGAEVGGRASTSYLLWVASQARMAIDMGGGSYLRYGQSQAKLADLSLVGLSHFHPDHVSDFPALMWLSTLTRTAPMPVVGPSGNDLVPPLHGFLYRLFDGKDGAFQVMGTALGGPPPPGVGVPGRGGSVLLVPRAADVSRPGPTTVYSRDGITVAALGIPHGNIPTLAYRVKTRGFTIVFSSDQNGSNPRFVDFARGADVLVMHLNLGAGQSNTALHASPATVGRIAQSAGVGRLILGHIGNFDLTAAVAELRTVYTGPLTVGTDLQCTPVK